MKKLISSIMLAVALALAGCVTSGDLAPEGVYNANAIVYNAEQSITTSYLLMDNFLKWEFDNRAAFTGIPEVKKAADHIRANGKKWISSAIALNEAYKLNPTDENRSALDASLDILDAALMEAMKYMTATP